MFDPMLHVTSRLLHAPLKVASCLLAFRLHAPLYSADTDHRHILTGVRPGSSRLQLLLQIWQSTVPEAQPSQVAAVLWALAQLRCRLEPEAQRAVTSHLAQW